MLCRSSCLYSFHLCWICFGLLVFHRSRKVYLAYGSAEKAMSKTTNSSVCCVIFKDLIGSFFTLLLRWIYWLLRVSSETRMVYWQRAKRLNYKVTPTGVYLSLQFNDNQLDSWEDLDQFKTCTKLQTVYLERNPIWKDTAYRRKVKLYLPNVTQIDATLCG